MLKMIASLQSLCAHFCEIVTDQKPGSSEPVLSVKFSLLSAKTDRQCLHSVSRVKGKVSIDTLLLLGTACHLSVEKLLSRPGPEPAVSLSCRHDGQCSCSSCPHDLLHRVCFGVFVPGLHSVLCAEGVLHHLRHHICAELHSPHHQLQTTSLLE